MTDADAALLAAVEARLAALPKLDSASTSSDGRKTVASVTLEVTATEYPVLDAIGVAVRRAMMSSAMIDFMDNAPQDIRDLLALVRRQQERLAKGEPPREQGGA